ncbi:transcription factor GTE9-like [Cornus florida]|uniref:transcription factor GTE9-like n=1 Tax=Cornus florida TaxID=4283 RepID=UPI002896A24A|nr:transcription factor GTE9-like isoform X1 [Cornus florida]XP_059636335.1 transcription factor GTE9-like isoform X1 [Cornus florida]XP_059636336.1 transcription factor GTE9-like isoform X1 [Cornus florida]XP_059636337.1 transcription factor GTE9-like isoform X1 [Cornus florida]XP_059636804.1 transcription factor GTE9-like [Cornus florida]XP_059636805.1 transcription factor GTE9-like [Cornus florida]XP_059636861.1 transcription factor GTE9-like [Cornus florida]XP_059636862.1 transcription f
MVSGIRSGNLNCDKTKKKNVRKDSFVEVSTGKKAHQLQGFLQNDAFTYLKPEKIKLNIEALDDNTLCELERIIRSCLDARAIKAGKADQAKREEKERVARLHGKDKGRVEPQIRADESFSQKIAEARQMMQKRERDAARLRLQKLEKTVEFEDNLQIVQYFENLRVFVSNKPLELLGLFLKEDDFYMDEEAIDVEEGEILG